jgi:rhomboid protease GluP
MRSRWQLILPIGAGLALLAFLGVGEEERNVDFMAHCWGFLAGLGEGLIVLGLRLPERLTKRGQWLAAFAALALIGGAWLRASF